MINTYKLSIIGDPLGDEATGVIKQVAWRLEGTDGTRTAIQEGTVDLPTIDPKAPSFIPLAQITVPVLQAWGAALLNLPYLRTLIDKDLITKQVPPLTPLKLSLEVAMAAAEGVALI